ncbi:MAG: BTAD domain-containing putative transcriptional regulator [Aquabacterium sp.]
MTPPSPPPADDPAIALRLLGPAAWRATGVGADWQPLAERDALLLARLALDGPQQRHDLALHVWPAADAARAATNLRQRLFRLRRQCAALVDEHDGHLRLGAPVRCDVTTDADEAALSGPLMPGLAPPEPELQHWLDDARARWAVQRLERLAGRAQQQEDGGALAAAIATTQALLGLDPLQEHAWRRLMRLHYLRGDRAAAVASFERCEQVLRDELGLKPAAETLALLTLVEQAQAATPTRGPMPLALRRPPHLVGREHELAAMAAAWDAGHAFLLLGEAGLGKSRLLETLAGQDPQALLLAAWPGDAAVPFATLARLLRAIVQRAGPALQLDDMSRRELARLLPEMGPSPTAPGHQALLLGAVDSLFASAGQAGVGAVLVDDLQHADEASQAALLRAVAQASLRWGFACRPQGTLPGAWPATSSRVEPVRLAPLMPQQVERLLDSLALAALQDTGQKRTLARRCGGNPLFLLEFLKQGWLTQGLTDLARLPVPPSVEALLAERLGRLSDAALALARVAVIAGQDFSADLALRVLACTSTELMLPWRELEAAQVLQGDGLVHDTMAAAVLAGLPEMVRRDLHGRTAAALSALGRAGERIALHHAGAQSWGEAAQATLAAAAHALQVGSLKDQLQQLRTAVDWFDRAGQPQRAFFARVQALSPTALIDGPAAAAADLPALRIAAGDPAAAVALGLAELELALWRYDGTEAARLGAELLSICEPGSIDELRAGLGRACGLAIAGQPDAAQTLAGPLVERIPTVVDDVLAAELWGLLAMVLYKAGAMSNCVAAQHQQIARAERAGHLEALLAARGGRAACLGAIGRNDEALVDLRLGRALFARLGDSVPARSNDMNLALALIARLELLPAQDLLEGVRAYAARVAPEGLLHVLANDLLCELALIQGDRPTLLQRWSAPQAAAHSPARRSAVLDLRARVGLALGYTKTALTLWQEVGAEIGDIATCDIQLLRHWTNSTAAMDPTAAVDLCSAALQRCTRAGFPGGQAQALLRRAQALRRAAQVDAAAADLRQAVALWPGSAHQVLNPAELLAEAVRCSDTVGDADTARDLRARAARWWADELRHYIAPVAQAGFRANPLYAGLFD